MLLFNNDIISLIRMKKQVINRNIPYKNIIIKYNRKDNILKINHLKI